MNDYSTMEAGAALDALVAEKVMRWLIARESDEHDVPDGAVHLMVWDDGLPSLYGRDKEYPDEPEEWSPSTNIARAFEVVAEMQRKGWAFVLYGPDASDMEMYMIPGGDGWFAQFQCAGIGRTAAWEGEGWVDGEAGTAALAICRVALAAAEQEAPV